jgi:hypothetical protein
MYNTLSVTPLDRAPIVVRNLGAASIVSEPSVSSRNPRVIFPPRPPPLLDPYLPLARTFRVISISRSHHSLP